MGTNTDFILIIFLIISIFRGWRMGIIRSLITPVSFLIGFIIGTIYFDLSVNIVKTLFVVFISSLVISLLLSFSLSLSRRSVNKKDRAYVFIGSRITGMITNCAWQGVIFASILLIITFLPGKIVGFENIQKDINKSMTYYYIQVYVINQIPIAYNVSNAIKIFNDPVEIKAIQETQEYKGFMEDPLIKDVSSDPETMIQLQDKNIFKLMDNPKIRAIFNDEDLMVKFTRLYQKAYKEKSVEFE